MPLKAVCQGRAFGTSAKPISPLTDWRGLLHCHQEVIPPTVISSPAPHQQIPLRSMIAGNEKPQNPTKIQESPLSCFSPHFVEKHAGQGHDRGRFLTKSQPYPPCKRGSSPSLTYPLHGSTGRSYAHPLRSVLPANQAGGLGGFCPPVWNAGVGYKYRIRVKN